MSVFEKRKLIEQNFFQKMFKKLPKKNFIIEVENILFDNESNILSVQLEKINLLKQKYRVNNFSLLYEKDVVFTKYFNYCISNKTLSDDVIDKLKYLCLILNLKEKIIDEKIEQVSKQIYLEKIREVIKDDVVTDEEWNELKRIEKDFHIAEDMANDIYAKEVTNKIQDFVNPLIQKHRVSPDEELKLNSMVKGLRATVTFDGDGIPRGRKYWDAENGELHPIETNINLQKSEVLYYETKIDWYEERSKTTTVSYGGVSAKFKICKGVSFRAGMIAPERYTEEYMKLIDSGTVFFTNKRIIFMGEHANKLIPYTKILSFTPFSDGVEIGKDTGKPPFFRCSDSELMSIYLARLLKEN